ncbi:sugar ABC transporter substrate-binding protein [Clostridium sp. ZS2-4]|uniref:sugar ABC transporter substrate-binding protein n=1 Tax=Clostridium sp. ZS2-4 TaxID=2987703 RepID=UPI00227A08CC|nr:sugar ABC transporter substrate-binding protein [Clostridium sp. ZS2-4]MCY6354610.1 sugar ABC transporter substrate-binding protein [Clostridium sp. ZS2-4]
MKIKKILGTVIISTMLASSFVACGNKSTATAGKDAGAEKKSEEVTIGVVLKTLNSDYWKLVQAGALDEAKKLGVKIEVIGPNAETDIMGQTSMMEDQITKNVSALVISPSQPSAAITSFDKADEEKIPVLLIDTDAQWDKKKSFIGTGNVAGGKMAGKYIGEKIEKGSEIVFIRGALGDVTHDERVNGAKEEIEAAGLKLIEIQPADSDRNKAMTVMENLLQIHSNVKAVFCSNDEMALGAVRALKQANKKDVLVVGFDGSPDALKSIKAGELTATVAQNAYNMGKSGVEAAVKVAKGEKIDARIDTGTSLIDKANVKKAQEDLNKILGK